VRPYSEARWERFHSSLRRRLRPVQTVITVFVFRSTYFNADTVFCWWPQGFEAVRPLLEQASIVVLRQCPEPLVQKFGRWSFKSLPFHTPLIDLTRTEEELWQKLDPKSCRYEIRKAQKLDCAISLNEETEAARLLLNESIRRMRYRHEVTQQRWETELHLHDVFLCRWHGIPLATHVLLRDAPHRAKLLFSATVDRSDERFRPVVGPCNRLLHWHELRHYKAKGFHYYDFGGCDLDKAAPDYPITQFKLSFGGEVVAEPTLFLAKNPAVRALFRGLGAGQRAVRRLPWPEAWLQVVRTRSWLADLFR